MLYSWKSDIFHRGDARGPKCERSKGRWIICGYSMEEWRDYGKTTSHLAGMVAYRILLTILVMMRTCELVDEVFDITTAYLWALKLRRS